MAHSPKKVAERAGVDPEYVAKLIDVGVLAPDDDGSFTEGDVRRTRLYQSLERAGLSFEAMVEAVRSGEVSFASFDSPLYDRFAGLTATSFREVSEREGVPLDLLLVVRESAGLAQADPDDPMRDDELQVVPLLRLQLSLGFDPAVVERSLRVYGDAFRRIAETEADWWHTQVSHPHIAAGMSEAEMQAATVGFGEELAPLIEQAMFALYRANQEHTWTENLIDEVEDALDRAGLHTRMTTAPAICFLDITGYTQMTEERGDLAAAELADRLTPLVQRPAERHGGRVVKWLGDGVMFYFRTAIGGVTAALEMVDAVETAGRPPAHVGLHTGPVVFQGGDYFGRTVNVASRISSQAGPGQVLVSQEVVDRVASDGFSFESVGSFDLKGVAEPVPLHSVTR